MIEDTEDALIEFFAYQLSTTPENVRLGEKYLRLYGVLNAVYLQSQALIQLAELVKYQNKITLKKAFANLKVIELRHIAASHTVNFVPFKSSGFKTSEGAINTFRITQTELKADGSNVTVADAFGSYEEINLKKEIASYAAQADEVLYEITAKYIN